MSSNSSLSSRVQELEVELELLKRSTAQALDQSWQDVERLENENRKLREELYETQEKLMAAEKKAAPRRFSLCSTSNHTASTSSTSVSTGSGGSGGSGGGGGNGGGGLPMEFSVMSRPSSRHESASIDDSTRSWGPMSAALESISNFGGGGGTNNNGQPSQMEKDLLRQLEVLQEDKMQSVNELSMKLKQREAAIETLESALAIKEHAFLELRSELDEVRTNISVISEEIDFALEEEEDCSDLDSTAAHHGTITITTTSPMVTSLKGSSSSSSSSSSRAAALHSLSTYGSTRTSQPRRRKSDSSIRRSSYHRRRKELG